MSLDADAIVDRRRLKRRLVVWRLAAIVVAVGLVGALVWRQGGVTVGSHVAELSITGVMLDDQDRLDALARIATDSSIKALILRIDSPGGAVVAGENLYNAVRAVAAEKPVVALIEGVGASAGYMVALAADRIFAHETSVTGSIGVLVQTADISQMLTKLGITADAIKSSPLKGEPNPLTPTTAAARAATQAVVDDTYRWFVNLLVERRKLPPATALQLADGRIFTGRQAVSQNLIDATGGLAEARTWLQETKDVARSLPVAKVTPSRGLSPFNLAGFARKTLLSETLTVDGLVSLWQPETLR